MSYIEVTIVGDGGGTLGRWRVNPSGALVWFAAPGGELRLDDHMALVGIRIETSTVAIDASNEAPNESVEMDYNK